MLTSMLFPMLGLLAVGLALRLSGILVESRTLRYAWDFFSRGAAPGQDLPRHDFINRTIVALSASKLVRLLSLLFVVPPAIYFGDAAAAHIPASATTGSRLLDDAIQLAALAAAIVLFLTCFTALWMRRFYDPDRPSSVPGAPAWLRFGTVAVPAPIAAAGMLWDWMLKTGGYLFQPLNLQRPAAQLIEQEGTLRFAIGGERFMSPLLADAANAQPGDVRTERDMIRSIQRLDQTLVREVMRPLNNVMAVSLAGLTTERFLGLAKRTGYSRFPCYHDRITNLTGYLDVYDFLETPVPPRDPRALLKKALYIPEIARLDIALQQLLRARAQLAICIDEFGGCSGVLSREDILEEITGEIMDEYDRPEKKIQQTDGVFIVEGSTDLDDLAEAIALPLKKGIYDTIAGFLLHRFSRFPRRGEAIEEAGWRIEVAQVEGHRIRKVRVIPPKDEDGGTD